MATGLRLGDAGTIDPYAPPLVPPQRSNATVDAEADPYFAQTDTGLNTGEARGLDKRKATER